MKLLLLAGIALAAYAAPITASMTCAEGLTTGSEISVSGAVYGGFNSSLGCMLTLYPDRLVIIAGDTASEGDGILNGFRKQGSGPGTISYLKAVFDLDQFGFASGYFSVLSMAAWFEYVEVLHVEASGTYSISEGRLYNSRARTVSLTLDTDPNAVVQTPEPSAVVGTTLGLIGVAFLRRRG